MGRKTITLVATVSRNGVLGAKDLAPWGSDREFASFRREVDGGVLIMDHRTWEALPRQPVGGCYNIIVTAYPIPELHDETIVVSSIEEAVARGCALSDRIYAIGGEEIHEVLIDFADRLLITSVNVTSEEAGETFPDFDLDEWGEASVENLSIDGLLCTRIDFIREEALALA